MGIARKISRICVIIMFYVPWHLSEVALGGRLCGKHKHFFSNFLWDAIVFLSSIFPRMPIDQATYMAEAVVEGRGSFDSFRLWLVKYNQYSIQFNSEVFSGMVTAMDSAVGSVVQQLRDSGVYENTVIVFVSDVRAATKIVTYPTNIASVHLVMDCPNARTVQKSRNSYSNLWQPITSNPNFDPITNYH